MSDGVERTLGPTMLRIGYANMRWLSRTYEPLRETLSLSCCGTGLTNAIVDRFASPNVGYNNGLKQMVDAALCRAMTAVS